MIPTDGPGAAPHAVRAEFPFDERVASAMVDVRPWHTKVLPFLLMGIGLGAGSQLIRSVRALSGAGATVVLAGFFVFLLLAVSRAYVARRRAAAALLVKDHGGRVVRVGFDDVGARVTIGDDYGFAAAWSAFASAHTRGGYLTVRFHNGTGLVVPLSALGENGARVRALAAARGRA